MLTAECIKEIAEHHLGKYKSRFEVVKDGMCEWMPVQILLKRDNYRYLMNFFPRDLDDESVFEDALIHRIMEASNTLAIENKVIFELK